MSAGARPHIKARLRQRVQVVEQPADRRAHDPALLEPFIRSGLTPASSSTIARISSELRSDPLLSEETATALEDIVRAAYERLAARDALEATAGHGVGTPPA